MGWLAASSSWASDPRPGAHLWEAVGLDSGRGVLWRLACGRALHGCVGRLQPHRPVSRAAPVLAAPAPAWTRWAATAAPAPGRG